MPLAPLSSTVLRAMTFPYEPPPSSIPIPVDSLAMLDSTRLRLDPSICRPPGLPRRSLSRTTPSSASSSVMPLSDSRRVLLAISRLRSDSLTRMPVSPLSATRLPSTRLPSDAATISMPPSLFFDTSLPRRVLSSARSSPMPRSPLPLTSLPSSRLASASRTSRPGPELVVIVLPVTTAPVVPLTSAIPSPLPSTVFARTTLPAAASNSSTAPPGSAAAPAARRRCRRCGTRPALRCRSPARSRSSP